MASAIRAAGILAIFLTVGFVPGLSARASLGGKLAPRADGAAPLQLDGYQVQETESDGVKVREYALPSGKVFGVAWDGAEQPDLESILGSYFEEYRKEATREVGPRQRHGGPRLLKSRHLRLERSGHVRDWHGRAWLPQSLPEGFKPEELK